MRASARFAAAFLLAGLLVAPVGPSAASRPLAPRPAAAATAGWPTYHLDNTRAANDTAEPAMTATPTAWAANPVVDGRLFATPIVWNGLVYVATENDSVYAFNEATGQPWWSINLGTPVDPSALFCNNPASEMPTVGITSTPAIDTATGTLYAVGLVPNAAEPNHFGMNFVLWAIDSGTGRLLSSTVIDYPDLDPRAQGERGALAISGGYVYIPFGGRDGDCSPYHPHVVAVPEAGGTPLHYHPQFGTTYDRAGLWAPGGEGFDAAGNVYVLTGNGGNTSQCDTAHWDHGDTLVKLTPALAETGTFVPPNWCSLNAADADLGSVAPALIPGTNFVFVTGKSGQGWIVDTTAMPGFSSTSGPAIGGSCSGVFGGMASNGTYLYVPCENELYQLSAFSATGTMFTAQGIAAGSYSAPILAGGRLWALDEFGSNLHAWDPTTRAALGSWAVGSHTRFQTLAADSGRIFVGLKSGTTQGAVAALNFANQAPPPPPPLPSPGNYHPVAPSRLLDTRTTHTPIGPHSALHFDVAGHMGLSAANVQAVALNVTAIDSTAPGYLAVYSGTGAYPGTSNVNFGAGQQAAAMVDAPTAPDGTITVYNGSAFSSVDVILDAMGWVSAAADGGPQLKAVNSIRELDTRTNTGGHPGPLPPGQHLDLDAVTPLGVPSGTVVTAVLVNLTALDAAAPGYVTAYPQGGALGTSNVNYAGGQQVANRAIVPVNPANGQISLFNGSQTSTVDAIVDVTGYFAAYTPATAGLHNTLQPARVFDSRTPVGGHQAPLTGGTWTAVQLTGRGGVPASVQAVVLTLTGTDATAPTYFTISATGSGTPSTSDDNFVPGAQQANLAVTPVDGLGRVYVYNSQGTADAIVDVLAWFS